MRIKFKPINHIKKMVRGKYITLFYPWNEYDGIKYPDGTILADSPRYGKSVKIKENDVIILVV